MTDLVVHQKTDTRSLERLAAATELAEFRAIGVRPAPRRQLACFEQPAPMTVQPYTAWPVLVTAILQLTIMAIWAVIR